MDKKTALLLQIIDLLYMRHVETIAENAGVGVSTLYKWMDGTTENPRSDTLFKVAEALGLEISWKVSRKLKRVA